MKKLMAFLVAIAIPLFTFANVAFAEDLAHGSKVFQANCAACHAGGKNLVNAAKTLKKEDLEKFGMYDAASIKTQVTNGKAAMPSFKGRLSADEINDVAAYVIDKADKGW